MLMAVLVRVMNRILALMTLHLLLQHLPMYRRQRLAVMAATTHHRRLRCLHRGHILRRIRMAARHRWAVVHHVAQIGFAMPAGKVRTRLENYAVRLRNKTNCVSQHHVSITHIRRRLLKMVRFAEL